jgi:hypothetical protein
MATNPETVVPSAPPPQGDAARHAQGRAAIREYLRQNKGKATLKGVTDLAATFGLIFSKKNEPFVKLAVEWANREDTDVDLLQITTDPLAPATGDAAQTEIIPPGFVPTPEPAPTPLEAFYTGAADVFAREPSLGLDPENRQYVESLGLLGRSLYAPLGDIGAGALTTIQAGLEGTGLAAGQLMEDVGLLYLIEQATGVKQTPEYAQRQFLGMLESEGLRAPMGYVPPGYAVATGQVPVSASRMAQALERAEPLPLTAPPPTPMARIAQAPEIPPTRITPRILPRAAAAAPEAPPPSLPSFSPRPLSGEEVAARVGILQGEKKNRVSDLSQYAPRIYRETDFDSFRGFLPWEDFSLTNTPFGTFVADTPDMALGQGSNRGVLLEFDAEGVLGRVNELKPAWQVGFGEGLGSEFFVSVDGVEQLKKNLRAIRIADEAQAPSRFITERRLKEAGWPATRGDGFTEYTRPVPAAAAPGPAPAAAAPGPAPAAAAPGPAPAAAAPGPVPAAAPVIPSPTVAAPTRQPVVPTATMTAPQRAAALQTLEQKGLTQPIMEHGLSKKAASFAADYLNEAKLTRPEDVPFTQFFYDHFAAGTLPDNVVQDLYKKYDMDYLDIVEAATGLRASASELGRGLGLLSIISRRVPTAAAELAKAGVRSQPDPSVWIRAGNAMRGLMVSQIATTMRNIASTGLRVVLDPFVATVDNVINATLNPVRKLRGQDTVPVNPLDALVLVTQQFKGEQKGEIFRQLAKTRPKINRKLLSAYSPDVTRPILNDKFGKIEKAVDMLNIFNRASEYVTRRAAFPAFLRREAQRKGLDFDALVNNNQLHTIPKEIMEKALNETLDLVYARRPGEGGPLFLGKSSKKIVDFIEDLGPVGASVVGFPNFIANALRFQFEYSPAGFFRLLSKKEQARLMKGDSDVMGKAVVGSAMLYAAMQFQDSEYAGSKWYNARLPNGKEVDLRPFFPAAPYLLLADLQKRYEDGTLDVAYTAADIVQGFSGAQFRAGGGLYAVDQLIRDLVQAGSIGEGAMSAIKGILGSSLGSVLTPMSTLKDVIAQFRPEEAVVRDTSEAPFLGQALRTVPFAQSELLGLPEQQYISQEAARTTDDPLLRQLTGAAIRPAPTIIQDEMRDLGFEDYDLYRKVGIPDLDRTAKELIGSIAEYNADAYFGSEDYQAADSLTKREMFKEFYKDIRSIVRDAIKQENPAYAALMFFQDESREDKIRLNQQYEEATGLDFKKFYSQLIDAPLVQTKEAFDALPAGTKYTDPGDYKVYTKK